jgi:signal transduction histidine kinase
MKVFNRHFWHPFKNTAWNPVNDKVQEGILTFSITFMVIASLIATLAYADNFSNPLQLVIVVLACACFLVLGIKGPIFLKLLKVSSPELFLGIHMGVLCGLGTTILFLSRGLAWFIMLPLVSQCIIFMTLPWALGSCIFVWLLLSLPSVLNQPDWNFLTQLQNSISLAAAVMFVAIFTMVAVRERQAREEGERLAAQLREANSRLREYAAQAEELATTKERNRLAREIHDSLGHYLTVVNMQLEAAKTVIETDPSRTLDAINKAQALTREGLGEIRRSVASLRAAPMSSRSLPEAVEKLVEENRAAGVITEYSVKGEPRALEPQAELTFYRAAQEGLTNVRKHAFASCVELKLDYQDKDKVRLIIHDNGVGANKNQGGFGLLGVRERVQLLNGQVQVQTAPNQGFTLEVELAG